MSKSNGIRMEQVLKPTSLKLDDITRDKSQSSIL